jgi:hypothetical protein
MSRLARARARDVVVAAEPDVVLMHGVAVLRRLGARITRYDAEADGAATRLHVETDALVWAPMFRRFRGDLLLLERP